MAVSYIFMIFIFYIIKKKKNTVFKNLWINPPEGIGDRPYLEAFISSVSAVAVHTLHYSLGWQSSCYCGVCWYTSDKEDIWGVQKELLWRLASTVHLHNDAIDMYCGFTNEFIIVIATSKITGKGIYFDCFPV